MNPKPEQRAKVQEQTAKKNKIPGSGKTDVEFAEEAQSSDYRSAFKNPVTGEERLY